MGDVDRPGYLLVDESTRAVHVAAREVDGFFAEADGDPSTEVVFRGVTESAVRPGRELADSELCVVDRDGREIGSYYIGHVEVVARPVSVHYGEAGSCVVTFGGYTIHFPGAPEVWRRWGSGVPLRSGEWMERPVEAHASWLHVTQNAWFTTGFDATRYETGEECVLDGRRIVGESSFFCELGESLNGVGGYFGSNLDALEDCLVTAGQRKRPRRLTWQHSSTSRDHLADGFVASIVGILHEYDVVVRFT